MVKLCNETNNFNSKSIILGYVFTVMASLSIAFALVLVCAFIMLLTYTPQQKIDAKVSMSNIKTVSQLPDRRSSLSSQKSTTESSQTSGAPEQGVVTYDDNNNQKQLQQQHCDVNQMNHNNDAQYVDEQINPSTIAPIGTYQQPIQANSEQSYYTTLSIQPLMNRPCYATICLPGQPQPQPQPQCQFVPTSDAGDAFIDANYDTLIRNSSANKTTSYVPASPTKISAYSAGSHINGAYASSLSSSSSPNSLTTHTNLSNNYNYHQQDPNSKQQYHNHLQSELINGAEQLYAINNKQDTSNNQVTLILTNGTTTSNTADAKNLNYNSLATHV